MERPFDQIRRKARILNREENKLFQYVFEKSDSITLWLIGLAIGGISIYANNIADIEKTIPNHKLKVILALLAISVTGGLIYRGMALLHFVVLNKVHQSIDLALSDEKTMDTESRLSGSETFSELVDKVKKGVGKDLSFLKPLYENSTEKHRQELYESVVKHYNESIEFARKDTSNILQFLEELELKYKGHQKDARIRKTVENNPAKLYKFTLRATQFFYFVYLLAFIVSMFWLAFSI